MNFVVLIT
jgi:hypothetical protein